MFLSRLGVLLPPPLPARFVALDAPGIYLYAWVDSGDGSTVRMKFLAEKHQMIGHLRLQAQNRKNFRLKTL